MKKLMKYLVKLSLRIGEYEKTSIHVVEAANKAEASERALINECHCEPDWDEWAETKEVVWDCGEFIYEPISIDEITKEDNRVLKKLGISYV